jgi:hypothetical protein
MQCASRVSAFRRELNSHNAARSRAVLSVRSLSCTPPTQNLPSSAIPSAPLQRARELCAGRTFARYFAPLCQLHGLHCVMTTKFQFVRRAAGTFASSSLFCAGGLNTSRASVRLRVAFSNLVSPALLPMLWPIGKAGNSGAALPNPSVNRTLHGLPAFGPPFHSGPNTANPFRAGYFKR